MPRYSISHKTTYNYSAPVIQSNHLLHLEPRQVGNQTIIRHSLIVEPAPAWKTERMDYFGNRATLISLEAEHTNLSVTARTGVDVVKVEKPDFMNSMPWEGVAQDLYHQTSEISQYICHSDYISIGPEIYAFAREAIEDNLPILEAARRLTEHIYENFKFDNTVTDVSTPVTTVLEQKSGVCQDFAHLEIAALRSLGLAARYVSGYILTHPPEGQEKLAGTDATHAWISVWAPEIGWVDFDPTNNCVPSGEHISVAYGRDFADVSPMSGILLGGGDHLVSVAVDVVPVENQ